MNVRPWSHTWEGLSWPRAFCVPAPQSPRRDWVEAVRPLFPGLVERLAATPQDTIHHAEGDVWTHTQAVVDAALALGSYAGMSDAERGVVFYAALLHDVSKPETTRHVGERIVAPGHSARGAIAARRMLWHHGVPFPLREQVCRLIEAHQVPFFAFEHRRAVPADYTARWLACDRDLSLLNALAEADVRGRLCPDRQHVLDNVALFGEMAQELGCWNAPYAFPDAATRMAYVLAQGQRFADEPVFVDRPFEVVVLSGLPASGKNTWLRTHGQGRPSVSYDDLREELGLKHGQGTGTLVHAADDRMREHLRRREPFVVNATHLSRSMRRRTLSRIREYGGHVRAVYLEAPESVLLARNASRDTSLSQTQLLRMTERWEVPGLDEVEHLDLVTTPPALTPRLKP